MGAESVGRWLVNILPFAKPNRNHSNCSTDHSIAYVIFFVCEAATRTRTVKNHSRSSQHRTASTNERCTDIGFCESKFVNSKNLHNKSRDDLEIVNRLNGPALPGKCEARPHYSDARDVRWVRNRSEGDLLTFCRLLVSLRRTLGQGAHPKWRADVRLSVEWCAVPCFVVSVCVGVCVCLCEWWLLCVQSTAKIQFPHMNQFLIERSRSSIWSKRRDSLRRDYSVSSSNVFVWTWTGVGKRKRSVKMEKKRTRWWANTREHLLARLPSTSREGQNVGAGPRRNLCAGLVCWKRRGMPLMQTFFDELSILAWWVWRSIINQHHTPQRAQRPVAHPIDRLQF